MPRFRRQTVSAQMGARVCERSHRPIPRCPRPRRAALRSSATECLATEGLATECLATAGLATECLATECLATEGRALGSQSEVLAPSPATACHCCMRCASCRRLCLHTHAGPAPYHGTTGIMSTEQPRYQNPLHEEFFRAAASVGMPANPDFNDWSRPQVRPRTRDSDGQLSWQRQQHHGSWNGIEVTVHCETEGEAGAGPSGSSGRRASVGGSVRHRAATTGSA